MSLLGRAFLFKHWLMLTWLPGQPPHFGLISISENTVKNVLTYFISHYLM